MTSGNRFGGAAAFGALACLQGLGSRVVALGVAAVGPNGETLHTAQSQRRTPAQIHAQAGMKKTGQKVPESHQELSDRDGVVSGGGALSERAEGRQRGGNATLVR